LKVDFVNSENELIGFALQGNQLAQYKIYEKYSKAMFSICYRMMNNREEAEDVLQESFSDAFSKLTSFRFESTFGAWIKQIVVNRCINKLTKRKIDLFYSENISNYDNIDENDHSEDELNYEVNKVRNAIQLLPDGYRTIFSLYLLEGYDHEEISEILGISESTSKTQYIRAKNKLKEILKITENE